MSRNEWEEDEFPEPHPKLRASARRAHADAAGETGELTSLLPQDAELGETGDATQSMSTRTGELTESMGPALLSSLPGDADTEDVFVLLPDTASIPVVSAEDVTEFGPSRGSGLDVTEDVTDEFLAGRGHPDSTSLDDLTTDIDDDLLAMGAEGAEEFNDLDGDEDDSPRRARKGRRKRAPRRFARVATLCCVLLLAAVAGLFVLNPPQLREFLYRVRLLDDPAASGGGVATPVRSGREKPPTVDPTGGGVANPVVEVVSPPADRGGNDPTVDGGGDPSDLVVGTEMDHLAASRQFFRERVVLAFRLGYVGEAEHE